jgi:SsrA-binding protein
MSINNRKAHHEYFILEEIVAGLQLLGSEVKSLRDNNANINDSYVLINDNEVFIRGMFISKYKESSWINHEEVRDRKLLLTRKQISDLQKQLKVSGTTIVPLSVYTVKGRFKVRIGVAKGKKTYDKKASLKEKDIKKQTDRELNRN